MSEKITKIKDSNFDSAVLFPKKPAVVFFSADWSETSGRARAVFETAAEKHRNKAAFYELDVDENPIISRAYGVRRIPAVLTFSDGRFSEALVGAITAEKLNEKIEKTKISGEFYKSVAAVGKRFADRLGMTFGF